MIAFDCPGCGKNFEVKDEFGGRKTKCPKCGAGIVVPVRSTPPAEERPPVPAAAPKFCSGCGQPWASGARFCGACGAPMAGPPTVALPVASPMIVCVVCRTENNTGAAECVRCKLPIGNLDALKSLRRNVVAEQRRCRKELLADEMLRVLDDDEFLCYLTPAERGTNFYIATERRLVSFKNVGWFNAKYELELSFDYSDIISITDVRVVGEGLMKLRAAFTVNTHEASVEYWFDASTPLFGEDESRAGLVFFNKLREAYQVYLGGSRVAAALLMRAKL
ncbi:MAG: zinc ribbon domain-containing protein [Planctomycetes bacterium]|nr:zinc ribbon domain-containing protein [Planctomycetota bacterium]